MAGDNEPGQKLWQYVMITSQNLSDLPEFSRVMLKNMGRPGDEARTKLCAHRKLKQYHFLSLAVIDILLPPVSCENGDPGPYFHNILGTPGSLFS